MFCWCQTDSKYQFIKFIKLKPISVILWSYSNYKSHTVKVCSETRSADLQISSYYQIRRIESPGININERRIQTMFQFRRLD